MNEKPGELEVRQEIYIEASPETVFALLTDATAIEKWQAEIVEADPVPGGVFRLAESGGMQIEGHYVEVVPCSKVVYTWGGVLGVAPGQSTVEFLLEPSERRLHGATRERRLGRRSTWAENAFGLTACRRGARA